MRIVVTGFIAGPDRIAARLGRGYGLDAAAQMEPHLPAAVSNTGAVR